MIRFFWTSANKGTVSRMKRKGFVAGIIILVLIACISGSHFLSLYLRQRQYTNRVFSLPDNFEELPRKSMATGYLFDPDDKRLMSGFSDHIAVAVVEKISGTSYERVSVAVDGTISGTPYMNYEIKIIRDIKGQLTKDSSIPLFEYGGVSIDGQYVEYITPFLGKGKCYVVYLSSVNNGNLYLNQAYALADAALEKDGNGEIIGLSDESAIQEYVDAYDNQNPLYAR